MKILFQGGLAGAHPGYSQLVLAGTQLSPFGMIPKSSQPGQWQFCLDPSSAMEMSVNDGIEPELQCVYAPCTICG
jgi:hypothetical protein